MGFKSIAAFIASLFRDLRRAEDAGWLFDVEHQGTKVGEMRIVGQSVELSIGNLGEGVRWPHAGAGTVGGGGCVQYAGDEIASFVFQLFVGGPDNTTGHWYLIANLAGEAFVQVSAHGTASPVRRFDLVPVAPEPEPVYLMRAGLGMFGLHVRRGMAQGPEAGRAPARGQGRLDCG